MKKIGFIVSLLSLFIIAGCSSTDDSNIIDENYPDFNLRLTSPREWTNDYYVYPTQRHNFVLSGNCEYPYEEFISSQFELGENEVRSYISSSYDGKIKRFSLRDVKNNKWLFDCFNEYGSWWLLGIDESINTPNVSYAITCEDKYNVVKRYLAGEDKVVPTPDEELIEKVEVEEGKYGLIGGGPDILGYIYTYIFPDFGLKITTPLSYFLTTAGNGNKEKNIEDLFKIEGNMLYQNKTRDGEIATELVEYIKIYDKKADENLRDLINPECEIGVSWPVGLGSKYNGVSKIYDVSKKDGESCMFDDENEGLYVVFESKDRTKYYKAVVDLGGCGGGPCSIFETIEVLR